MNRLADALMRRLGSMSVMRQTTLMVGSALVGANLLTLFFYSIFFQERLLLDLLLTSIIVVMIGYPLGFLFIEQNVRLRSVAQTLDRISSTDELSGLGNRRYFMHEASKTLRGRPQGAGALLYIDIDHFKQINDTYGHFSGDRVLKALGSAIADCLPEGGIAARIGGEEFTIYLPESQLDEALDLAENIRRHTRALSRDQSSEVRPFTVSIGVARRQRGDDLEGLMKAADRQLYQAKRGGRDQVVSEMVAAA